MKNHPLRRARISIAILTGSAAVLLGAFASETRAENPNLIKNGGFETGNFQDWTTISAPIVAPNIGSYYGVSNASGSSFFVAPPSAAPGAAPGPFPFLVNSGNYAAFFGATNREFDTISQTFRILNQPLLKGKYRIAFALAPNANATLTNFTPSAFQAVWDGKTIYSTADARATSYQELAFNEKATGDSATLTFQGFSTNNYYYLDDVSVQLVGFEQSSFAPYAQTPNQRAVAKALDSLVTSDQKVNPIVLFLDYRDLDALPADFDRIAPEELTSVFTLASSLSDVQAGNLQRRGEDLRSGSAGFSANGLAMQGSGPAYSGSFLGGAAGPTGDAKESKELKQTVSPEEKKWGAFLTGVGEWVDVQGDGNARGFDMTTGGFTLGLDYKVSNNFAIGLAAGYAGTAADLTEDGRLWVNGGKLGVYATTFVGGWYADFAINGGINSYDTKRTALNGTARGSTDGTELNGLIGTGYDFKVGALSIGPTATFQYTRVDLDGFTEHGSLAPLDINDADSESLRSAFGFKASYDWRVGGMIIKPEIRAAWQHDYSDRAASLSASFASGAGDDFRVNGPTLGRDSALVGAGFAVQLSESFTTYVFYDGELGRDRYERHTVSGGLRVAF